MKKSPYKILSSKTVYKNLWLEVKEEEVVNFKGQRKMFGTVDNGQGVQIVAINKQNEVFLIKEFYYVLGEYGIHTPAGGIENGETPLQAAKKELQEETGQVAKNWISLGLINPLTMIIKSPQHLFLALDLEEGSKTEDDIEVIRTSFDKACDMAINGEITLAPSCLAILKANEYLKTINKIS